MRLSQLSLRIGYDKPTSLRGCGNIYYSEIMFLGFSQVNYLRFKCNTHNNYNYIIKTKGNYNWKLLTTERESPSKVGLGLR